MLCNPQKVYSGRLAQLVRALRSHRLPIMQGIDLWCGDKVKSSTLFIQVRKSAQENIRMLRANK